MNKQKKTTPKNLSNRQKVKEQAKELKKLRKECNSYEIRNEYLREIVLDKQILINEQVRKIESLKSEVSNLEINLSAKKPFWKRVLG